MMEKLDRRQYELAKKMGYMTYEDPWIGDVFMIWSYDGWKEYMKDMCKSAHEFYAATNNK